MNRADQIACHIFDPALGRLRNFERCDITKGWMRRRQHDPSVLKALTQFKRKRPNFGRDITDPFLADADFGTALAKGCDCNRRVMDCPGFPQPLAGLAEKHKSFEKLAIGIGE